MEFGLGAKTKDKQHEIWGKITPMFKTTSKFCKEDKEALDILENLRKELGFVQRQLDFVTDNTLIDGYIYEMQSIHMKYNFYLKLCKERGVSLKGLESVVL